MKALLFSYPLALALSHPSIYTISIIKVSDEIHWGEKSTHFFFLHHQSCFMRRNIVNIDFCLINFFCTLFFVKTYAMTCSKNMAKGKFSWRKNTFAELFLVLLSELYRLYRYIQVDWIAKFCCLKVEESNNKKSKIKFSPWTWKDKNRLVNIIRKKHCTFLVD